MKLIMESWRQHLQELEHGSKLQPGWSGNEEDVEKWAALVREEYQLVKQLKQEAKGAPGWLDLIRKNKDAYAKLQDLSDRIVKPYFDKQHQLMKKLLKVFAAAARGGPNTDQFIENEWYPHVSEVVPTMKKFYEAAKQAKTTITKEKYDMVLNIVEMDLKHSQAMLKFAQKRYATNAVDMVKQASEQLLKQAEEANKRTAFYKAKIEKLRGLQKRQKSAWGVAKHLFEQFQDAKESGDIEAQKKWYKLFIDFKAKHKARDMEGMAQIAKDLGLEI